MQCDDCKKKPASIFFKDVTSGKVSELHLCLECAQKRGIIANKKMSPVEMLQKLLREKNVQDEQIICPVCCLSLAEFKRIGRFGCSNCINAFETGIKHLIKEIQESERHVGRKTKPGEQKGLEIFKLREELKKALATESYEEAAKIRDRLKSLGISTAEHEC